MKWCVIVSVLTVMYCVSETNGLKLLKKLKDILHPTEPTTTIVPILPQYEKQSYLDREEDSKSWEQDSSTSKTKPKHSEEDISTSHSSEKLEDSFSNSNNKYNIKNSNKVDSHNGDSFKLNSFVTTTNNYDSAYGTNKGSQFSSHGSFNEGSKTTTHKHEENNIENYPGQSSFPDNVNNQQVPSTTLTSYGFSTQNQPEQSFEGQYNQRVQSTTPRNNYGSYNVNGHNQLFNGDNEEIRSTTTENSDSYQNTNISKQSLTVNSLKNEKSQSTIPSNEISSYDNNKVEQSSSPSFGSQNQNHDSSVFSNTNNDNSNSTTPRNYDSTYGFDNPNHSPSYDGLEGVKSEAKNRTNNNPEQYYSSNNQVRTTTATYENTNYNEVQPGIPSGNNNYEDSYYITSTTSVVPDNLPEYSQQGGNQHSYNSGPQLLSSTTKGPNQKKYDVDDDILIFPDHPSLNPTPESKRTFTNKDPKYSNGLNSATPAPVNDEEGRRIIDGPLKGCGPGEVFDTTKNACKELARK